MNFFEGLFGMLLMWLPVMLSEVSFEASSVCTEPPKPQQIESVLTANEDSEWAL